MKRSFFLLGLAGVALTIATVRGGFARRTRRSGELAGRCASQRRNLRWHGYTAADFS